MAIVDADYHFTYVDVGKYRSNGDSGIFKYSPLGVVFVNGNLNIPGPKRLPGWPQGGGLPHCIVGDEARDPSSEVKKKTDYPVRR